MKKIAIWTAVVSLFVFLVVWGMIGLKILDNEYAFMTEAYIGYGALAVFFLSLVWIRWTNRCPYCGKIRPPFGRYCGYCGKELK